MSLRFNETDNGRWKANNVLQSNKQPPVHVQTAIPIQSKNFENWGMNLTRERSPACSYECNLHGGSFSSEPSGHSGLSSHSVAATQSPLAHLYNPSGQEGANVPEPGNKMVYDFHIKYPLTVFCY